MPMWSGNHLWVFTSWKHGGINKAIDDAMRLGFTGLMVKAHDGNPSDDPPEFRTQVNAALDGGKRQGLTVGAWGYLYGPRFGNRQVDLEAQAIIDTIGTGIDWYVIDAESEWETAGGADAARRLCETVRNRYPDFPIGLAPFWNTRWHTQYPYGVFARYCNVVLPQVYYVLAKRETPEKIQAMWQITQDDFGPLGLPVAPIGQLDGATKAQIDAFRATIGTQRDRSWWLWGPTSEEQLQAAAAGSSGGVVARSEYEKLMRRVEALESRLASIRDLANEPVDATKA